MTLEVISVTLNRKYNCNEFVFLVTLPVLSTLFVFVNIVFIMSYRHYKIILNFLAFVVSIFGEQTLDYTSPDEVVDLRSMVSYVC